MYIAMAIAKYLSINRSKFILLHVGLLVHAVQLCVKIQGIPFATTWSYNNIITTRTSIVFHCKVEDTMMLIVSLIGLAYVSLPLHAVDCNRYLDDPFTADCSAAFINCPLYSSSGRTGKRVGNLEKQPPK